MDTFRSLIFLVAVLFTGTAFAGMDTMAPVYQATPAGGVSTLYPDSQSACDAIATNYLPSARPFTAVGNACNSAAFGNMANLTPSCSDSTFSLNSLTGMCQKVNSCASGQTITGSFVDNGSGAGGNVCSAGCTATVISADNTSKPGYISGSWMTDGTSCTGGNSPTAGGTPNAPPTAPPPCAAGQTPVVTGGVASCVVPSIGSPASSVPGTGAAGSGTGTGGSGGAGGTAGAPGGTGGAGGAGGSGGAGGQGGQGGQGGVTDITPVVVAVDAATAAIKAGTLVQYCTDHADANICQKNVINAACGAFTCSGDAIQCAMAKDQFELHCKLAQEQNAQLDIGQKMIDGTDNSVPNPADVANRSTFSIGSLDMSSPYAARCPDDVVFSVMGKSSTLPLSLWCPYLTLIGNVFMALSLVSAAKIIGGV